MALNFVYSARSGRHSGYSKLLNIYPGGGYLYMNQQHLSVYDAGSQVQYPYKLKNCCTELHKGCNTCPFRNKLSFKTILHGIWSASHSEAYPAPLSPSQLDMTQSLVPVNPVVQWWGRRVWSMNEIGRNACSAAVWQVGQGEELSITAPASVVACGLGKPVSLIGIPAQLTGSQTNYFHPCGPFKVKIPLLSEWHIIQ